MKKPRNEFASKNDVRFDDEFQRFAHRAELRAKPITNTSQEVVVALASEIIEALVTRGNYKYRKQGQKLAEFEQAVSGFVYDLLKGVDNKAARGWVGAAFSSAKGSRVRIPMKPAIDSETKPATCSDFIPASIPI